MDDRGQTIWEVDEQLRQQAERIKREHEQATPTLLALWGVWSFLWLGPWFYWAVTDATTWWMAVGLPAVLWILGMLGIVARQPELPLPAGRSRAIPQDVKIAVADRDNSACRQCGATKGLHFDHIYPWSKGGANTVANVQLLCARCNIRKSDRLPR